jgi:hypothetical protein
MTIVGDKLKEALDKKNNDINTFVWKGAKTGKSRTQSEIKLVDATPEQLQEFYNHCMTMLYNGDKKNPGRYKLLEIIKDQRKYCNTELFLRYISAGDESTGRKPIPRFSFFQSLKIFLDNNKEVLPREVWDTTKITVIADVPAEFSDLSVGDVYRACLDSAGTFDKKHLTSNFICKMGLWFTPQEMKDLTEKDDNGNTIDRLTVVMNRLNLDPKRVHLYINNTGLSYKEFRAMINLRSKKYSELTTDQLTILRDKMLFRLEELINDHIKQWKMRAEQIKQVCAARNIKLTLSEHDS